MRALQAAQPQCHSRAHNSAADEPARRHAFGQRIHTSIPNSLLAPRRRTRLQPISIHGRPLAEGRLGRKGGRGGSEARLGRKRGWGGREPRAEGSLGRKGGRGRSEAGAEASMGRKGVWGGREYDVAQGTPRHTNLHFDPQATTFLSPPGGIYLINTRPSPRFTKNRTLLAVVIFSECPRQACPVS